MLLTGYLIIVYFVGFGLTIGFLCAKYKDDPSVAEMIFWLAVLWPLFWLMYPPYLLGKWIAS